MFWPGEADGRDVQILDTDKDKCQVLVMVKEGKATFVRHQIDIRSVQNMRGKLLPGIKLLKTHPNGSVDIQDNTTGKTRKYLMGRDERMLFMCEVKNNVTSMETAYASLKDTTVVTAEVKHLDVKRQGEWFMIPATKAETKAIEALLKKEPARLLKKMDIATMLEGREAAKPHVASEAVTMEPPKAAEGYSYSVRNRGDVFIRGTVRHADHPTRRLPVGVWHKVVRNTEVVSVGTMGGRGRMFRGSTYFD